MRDPRDSRFLSTCSKISRFAFSALASGIMISPVFGGDPLDWPNCAGPEYTGTSPRKELARNVVDRR
jgi:hypothetical protein